MKNDLIQLWRTFVSEYLIANNPENEALSPEAHEYLMNKITFRNFMDWLEKRAE